MNQVHLIDCMEFMQSLPDQHYDLAITDPPYGIGADVKNSSNEKAGKSSIVTRTHYGNQRWDDAVPSKEYFIELKRVSRRQIVWGVNYYPYSDIFAGGRLFWDKGVSMPSFSAGELAYLSFINSIDLVKITWDGMRQHNMRDKEHRIHPTQKPVALYSWLLAKYAEGGVRSLTPMLAVAQYALPAMISASILRVARLTPIIGERKRTDIASILHSPPCLSPPCPAISK